MTPAVHLALANRPAVSRLAVTAAPGSLVSGAVRVSSTRGAPVSVTLAPAGATTAPRGGERFVTTSRSGVGAWLHVSQPEVSLPPHGHVDVGFTFAVPAHTRPGQYVGGIVAVGPRVPLTIVVTVPGPTVARFSIVSAAMRSPRVVAIRLVNEGNVVRRPAGSVTVAGVTRSFRLGDFLPHASVAVPVALGRRLPPGAYTATVRVTYAGADGSPQTATAAPRLVVAAKPVAPKPQPRPKPRAKPGEAKSATPWWLIGSSLAAVVLLLAAAAALRRRPAARTHDGPHYWAVDWERRDVDTSGALRHLHRCRDCGVEVMARDVRDASLNAP